MSLRSAYASFFNPVFNASGEFSGQINTNLPGTVNIGNSNTTYSLNLNGESVTGGGGGGGNPSNWANFAAINTVNFDFYPTDRLNNLNSLPIYAYAQGSNVFGVGENAACNVQSTSVLTLFALGPSAGQYNGADHLYAFGNNAGFSNSANGSNVFVAGANAGYRNDGADLIAIGRNAAFSNVSGNVIAIGVSAAAFNKKSHVVAIGTGAGYNNSGLSCVFLGSNPDLTVSNNKDDRLVVYSKNAATPLLYGDILNRRLYINTSDSSYDPATANKLIVGGDSLVDGALTVAGNTTISGVVNLWGSNNIRGGATFFSNVVLNAPARVTSTLAAGATTLSSATVQGELNVSGQSTLSGAIVQNRLGVGTTNPGFDVEVNKSSYPGIGITESTGNYLHLLRDHLTPKSIIRSTSRIDIESPVNFTRMTILSNGNVGIGTSNPQTTLHVSGSIVSGPAISNANGYLNVGYGNWPATANPSEVSWPGLTFGYSNWVGKCQINAVAKNDGTYRNELAFLTSTHTCNVTEQMRITWDGKVGVGTSAPDVRLSVGSKGVGGFYDTPLSDAAMVIGAGTSTTNTATGKGNLLLFSSNSPASNMGASLVLGGRATNFGAGELYTGYARVSGVTREGGYNGNLVIHTHNQGVMGERMRITETGRVETIGPGAFADIAATSMPAALSLQSSNNTNAKLKLGAYYTGGVGAAGVILATDEYSGSDHNIDLYLNPKGGYVAIGKSNAAAALDVAGDVAVSGGVYAGSVDLAKIGFFWSYAQPETTRYGINTRINFGTVVKEQPGYTGRLDGTKTFWSAPIRGLYSIAFIGYTTDYSPKTNFYLFIVGGSIPIGATADAFATGTFTRYIMLDQNDQIGISVIGSGSFNLAEIFSAELMITLVRPAVF